MFNGAFPQVLASLLVPQTEHEGVLLQTTIAKNSLNLIPLKIIENLLLPLVIILDHHQGQLLLLEVQLGDLGPEEEPYKQ